MIYEGALGLENTIPGSMGFEKGKATWTALELCLGSKACIRVSRIKSIRDGVHRSF